MSNQGVKYPNQQDGIISFNEADEWVRFRLSIIEFIQDCRLLTAKLNKN